MHASPVEKDALRRQFILARESLTEDERRSLSARAAQRIASLSVYQNARTVLLYRAVRGELSLDPLLSDPASQGKRFAYPLCVSRTDMIAMIPGGWRKGPFGIPEPDRETSILIEPEHLDLVICPGTAFDSDGRRLGMGGGYYDRYLPQCSRALILMAAFEVQHASSIPACATDVSMDMIVTEQAVYTTNTLSFSGGPDQWHG